MVTSTGADGSLWGRYQLLRTLKADRRVRTLLATDLNAGGQVIIKVVESPLVSSQARARLEHEAAVLRRLESQWVAPVLEVFNEPDRFSIVMPYVPGVSLRERLATGPLRVDEALAAARCLLNALADIHDHGVVHCDVQPGNVVVSGGPGPEWATLVDFGYARTSALAAPSGERKGGTARYMSPEQAGLIGREVDERTDLYSLGILLFECLAGAPPFHADDIGQLLRQHLSARPPLLRGFGLPVPRALDEIVQRLLQKDPDDRYQSARAVLADLDALTLARERGISEPQIVVGARDRRQTLTEPALTGREEELALLTQHLEAARSGQGRLVMVEAKSGGGKTRLLEEFCRVATGDVWILRGQGVDRVATRPLQVLAGVAADVVSATGAAPQLAAELRSQLGDEAAALCRVLPELSEVLEASPDMTDGLDAHGQTWGVDSLVSLLDALGTPDRTAVVVLDDAQWIDEVSVRVLLAWAGREREPERSGPHVLIVVAARQEELNDEHPLRRFKGVGRIELPPLGREQIQEVAQSMAGEIPPEAVDVLVNLSGGTPFMILAVLRGLVESGALFAGEDGWRYRSASVGIQASREAAAFLAGRFELLDPTARRLLSSAAVLGREFDLRLASVLAGQDETASQVAMSKAVERHLVWQRDHQRFTFVHDRLRETLLEGLQHADLLQLHRRAAEEIELINPSHVFELSYHFDTGGQPERALPYAIRAAESARHRNDLELAERHYRIAERGAAHAELDTRRGVALGLGQVLMLQGRYDEAGQRLERALTLAKDEVTSARIQGELGELAFKHDDIEGAVNWIEQALRMLNQPVPQRPASRAILVGWELAVRLLRRLVPPRLRSRQIHEELQDRRRLAAHLYSRLLYAWYFSERGTIATIWVLLRQVNTAERCSLSRELAHGYGLYAGGIASACPILWKRALRYADRARALHQQRGDPWGEGHALCMRALVLCAAGRFSEGQESAAHAMRFLQRSGDPWELYWAAFHKALCLFRLGELRGAVEEARLAHQAAVALGDPQARATTLEIWAKASDGRLPSEPIEAALTEVSVDIQTATALLQAYAVRLRALGRHREAVRYAEQAVSVARQKIMNMYLVPALSLLTTLYREEAEEPSLPRVRRQRRRRARRAARRVRRYAIVYRNEMPHALREAAMIAALGGRNRRARRLFKASLRWAEQRQAQAEIAETLRLRARIGNQLGWRESANDLVESVRLLERIVPEPLTSARGVTLGLAERFDSLLAAGGPLVSAGSPEEIALAVEEAVLVLLRPERCWVIGAAFGREMSPDEPEQADWLSGETLLRHARELRCPVVLTESRADGASGDSMVLAGLRSALCAPVIVGDEVCGYFLASHSRVAGLFGEEEQRLAAFIAHLAGAALERERLQRSMRAGVVSAQEDERARVARDLHDEIGQAITSVLLGVRLVQTALENEPLDRQHLLERSDEVRQVATDALSQVQNLAFELRPTVLDDMGLVAALRRLAKDISARHEIVVDLAVSHLTPGDRLSPEVETSAYRVAQEALTNVVRHAKASACSVILARSEGRLRLVVEDDGTGFEPDTVRSLGLRGMAERAALLGGTLNVTSLPGEGTVVAMEVPLP